MRKKSSQFDQFEKSIAINSFLTAQRCCNLDFDKKKKVLQADTCTAIL